MNCRFILSRLSSYVDGELTGDQMLTVRRHLEQCASCRAESQTITGLKSAVGQLPTHSADEGLESRLLGAVRVSKPSTVAPTASLWPTWRSAATIAAAAIVTFAFLYSQRHTASSDPSHPATDIAMDQDWNTARTPFPSTTIPAGLDTR